MTKTRTEEIRFQVLLMKALDHEITENEQKEFDMLILKNEVYKNEYLSMKKVKDVTMQMQFRTPADAVWDHYWERLYPRLERGWGWLLFTIGAVILLTWCGFNLISQMIQNPNLSIIVKGGILLMMSGLSVLIVSVIREKWFIRNRDPYKEIRR